MAGTVRTLATISVRQHVPSIRFPARKGTDGQALKFSFPPPVSTSAAAPQLLASSSPAGNVGGESRGSALEDRELPAKYSRKPWSEEEIELIRLGGPY
ncbi:alpha-ketoglutarate dehydrogenase component 4-like [Lineus longissimus]|uniref:alpha-ketoglutarate dehydrogenase component 4-like n=1 Tax=Lineus longissimus TaxID=88925 RepID=UPI002B4F0611